MDELDLLTRLRPDPPAPTDAERAAARAALLAHIGGAPTPGRRPPRAGWAPRVLAVAVAVAIVVVALAIVGATGHDGGPPPATAPSSVPPTSLEGAAGPFPAPPYSVEILVRGSASGGSEPRDVTGTVVLHQVDTEMAVMDVSACTGCDATLLGLRLGDAPVGSVADVPAAVDAYLAEADDASVRLALVEGALQDPGVGLEVRRALLEQLAQTEGLVLEERSTTALGDVGTRYLLADDGYGGSRALVVDPADGYVLETVGVTAPATASEGVSAIHTPAGSFAPDGTIETSISRRRPRPEADVPDDVAELAATVRGRERVASGSCAASAGNEDLGGTELEIAVPVHLAYAYCPAG